MSAERPGASGNNALPPRVSWRLPAVVFLLVAAAQLWLVARAGTDIPFQDQWDVEGGWLFPKWTEGSLRAVDLIKPFNEHRIVWTHLLNLSLFAANGQWDPLVELVALAFLRAGCAGGLAWLAARYFFGTARWLAAGIVAVAFLPFLAWHGVLWSFESQVTFALGFSLLSLALLGSTERSGFATTGGLLAGAAAMLAMGPGAVVPLALLGLAVLRVCEVRRFDREARRLAGPAGLLLLVGLICHVSVPAHESLRPADYREFFTAAGRLLAWPHVGQPLAALPLNIPLLVLLGCRWQREPRRIAGDDFILLLGGWSVGIALATAWTRGGSPELDAGVPSRYVDFIVILPLANLAALGLVVAAATERWQKSTRLLSVAWTLFLIIGWTGLSGEVLRGVVLPRVADREAPIRLARAFQQSGDAAIFEHQPRLLVPHPNPAAVQAVLRDPRLVGKLPPSFQPEQPLGPLSRAARWLLRQ